MKWKAEFGVCVCVICGVSGSGLSCPANSLQNNGLEVYDSFIKLVDEFCQLDALPVELLFQNDVIVHNLNANKAEQSSYVE